MVPDARNVETCSEFGNSFSPFTINSCSPVTGQLVSSQISLVRVGGREAVYRCKLAI
jgi:hypothetical protein